MTEPQTKKVLLSFYSCLLNPAHTIRNACISDREYKKSYWTRAGKGLTVAELITRVQELEPLAHEYRTHLQATAIYYRLRPSETKRGCVYDVCVALEVYDL